MNKPTQEQWRPVPSYEGLYEVSDHGRVRSLPRVVASKNGSTRHAPGYLLSSHRNQSGYLAVTLSRQNRRRTKNVHSLVMLAFAGPRPGGMEVCHNDGNPANNHISNLRYDTYSENARDAIRHGRNEKSKRTHCPRGHELREPNLRQNMLKLGRRACLACDRARNRIRRHPELAPYFQEVSDQYYEAL